MAVIKRRYLYLALVPVTKDQDTFELQAVACDWSDNPADTRYPKTVREYRGSGSKRLMLDTARKHAVMLKDQREDLDRDLPILAPVKA